MRAVIFDFDGVIVDTEPIHLAALNEVLAAHGLKQIPREHYYAEMLGLDDVGLFKASYEWAGVRLEAEAVRALVAEKSQRYLDMVRRDLQLLPGVREFVEALRGRFALAVCSGALRHEIEFILEQTSLRSAFRVIVSAEDVERPKPDPQGYLLACGSLQEAERCQPPLEPGQCLVVEDSLPGIAAAKGAGMKCLAVATSHPAGRLAQADIVVESLLEVQPDSLQRLFAG